MSRLKVKKKTIASPIKKEEKRLADKYPHFDQLNGCHPLKEQAPESIVCYSARKRHGGKVSAFNFELAREIGLIPKGHPNQLTKKLVKKITDTFSLVIINEYDEIHKTRYSSKDLKANTYIATRYLQMQHPNKQGKTSGDGRSIWNGVLKSNGKSYDISSCGTGATCLSPATHLYDKFFKTGDPSISYGCGYSEVDEGLSTLFFSEILNKNGIGTERLLGIIEFQKGLSINIRVHENLIRPSHLFSHLKQGNFEALERMVYYFIDREEKNKNWPSLNGKQKKLDYFLKKECEVFAKLVAKFESEYIFCWLDWDGDNILMDGSIIDYGSIRQFGLYHHEYRFDDVTRFSTTIKGQRKKARNIIQTFAQMIDFLKNGKKRSLSLFKKDSILDHFDQTYHLEVHSLLVQKMGLSKRVCDFLLKKELPLIEDFYKTFNYFEKIKSFDGVQEVGDGVNWSVIFCMRDVLRELPQLYMVRNEKISHEEFLNMAKSSYARPEDLVLSPYRIKKIDHFQKSYWEIINTVSKFEKTSIKRALLEITMRSSIINKYDRVTGDSITTIVGKVMRHRPKLTSEEIYKIVHDICNYQTFDPELIDYKKREHKYSKIMGSILKIVRDFREGL